MRKGRVSRWVLAIGLLGPASGMAAEVDGTVRDQKSGKGVPALTVKLVPPRSAHRPEIATTTDAEGAYRFDDVADGKYLLEVYQGTTLVYRDPVTVRGALHEDVELEPKTPPP